MLRLRDNRAIAAGVVPVPVGVARLLLALLLAFFLQLLLLLRLAEGFCAAHLQQLESETLITKLLQLWRSASNQRAVII